MGWHLIDHPISVVPYMMNGTITAQRIVFIVNGTADIIDPGLLLYLPRLAAAACS